MRLGDCARFGLAARGLGRRCQEVGLQPRRWFSGLLGKHLACPPCNVGPRSTPTYTSLAQAAVHHLPTGETVFAGQRLEGFYVDLGSIFDLADLRPFQNLHLLLSPAAPGVDATKNLNLHSIAIQVPKAHLTRNRSNPTDPLDGASVIGVWGSAYRRKARHM